MEDNAMLSTIDNPFDPFTQWDEWLSYDLHAGHHTCEYLARVSINSDSLSEAQQKRNDRIAMETIIKEDPIGIYIIVYPNMIKNK